MKTVLISIKPEWCKLIAEGKKTIEVRKTFPKYDTPFRVLVYCTKGTTLWKKDDRFLLDGEYNRLIDEIPDYLLNGEVIGEFICTGKYVVRPRALTCESEFVKRSCVPVGKLVAYVSDKEFPKDHVYGWCFQSFTLYENPKELREYGLKRPPQSWQYIETAE